MMMTLYAIDSCVSPVTASAPSVATLTTTTTSTVSPSPSTQSSVTSAATVTAVRWDYLPGNVYELIFSHVPQRDLLSCMLVCRKWYQTIRDDRSDVWRVHCLNKLSKQILKSDVLSSLSSYKAKLRAYFYAWDSNDCSRNVYIKPNGFTLHRNPVAQSTDAAKGKAGFLVGRHSWEVWWEGPLGTVAVVGIATKDAPVQSAGYVALLGSNADSWGWNLVDNNLIHNGDCHGNYPLLNNAPKYQTGERLRVILDCDDSTLSFERNYEFLGVAFRGLPNKPLYPSVSAVYGNTEVSMVYLGYPYDG
ncbi:F-box/SPRY domain-containing protein 1-like [Oppia nitens]|uniref:F-box/SPRY domain-containing protein 1-like n=1 Tax=Oppia nitens TaxID=1686743 RepID=UPI0023D9B49F|nr:F-box/SPRY domain-containing protein 1-like [Oppia nitens]